MCDRCATLERDLDTALARNAELEDLLAGAVFVTENEAGRIAVNLKLTPDQSRLLVALYKAKRPLMTYELDQVIPVRRPAVHCNRVDPEFRRSSTVRVQLWNIRQRIGHDVMVNRYAAGVGLTEKGREMVREALIA